MSGERKIGCSSSIYSATCGLWDVNGNAPRKLNLLEISETGILFSFFEAEGNLLVQCAKMCFVEGKFVWVWLGKAQREQRVMDLQYFVGCPNLFLALTGGRNLRFDLTEGSTYVYMVWKILFSECNFCNICWVLIMHYTILYNTYSGIDIRVRLSNLNPRSWVQTRRGVPPISGVVTNH